MNKERKQALRLCQRTRLLADKITYNRARAKGTLTKVQTSSPSAYKHSFFQRPNVITLNVQTSIPSVTKRQYLRHILQCPSGLPFGVQTPLLLVSKRICLSCRTVASSVCVLQVIWYLNGISFGG